MRNQDQLSSTEESENNLSPRECIQEPTRLGKQLPSEGEEVEDELQALGVFTFHELFESKCSCLHEIKSLSSMQSLWKLTTHFICCI